MIDYPDKLNAIFEKLILSNIKPIIVGGYVRDKLLNRDSKDIDIELYGIDSLSDLEDILQEFGSVNSVGKSFGVCKLKFEELELDFSLPRSDSKIDSGHTGFKITTDKNLNFKMASSRRDFTINALGYDVINKKLLDPFYGLADLHAKILRAVAIKKFADDPLRVLRAVQFSTRFDLQIDELLFTKCQKMINQGLLDELPSERIFEEFKKLLLLSTKPSKGFTLLRDLGAFSFFDTFQILEDKIFENILIGVDLLASYPIENKKTTLMLALICSNFSKKNIDAFLDKLTNESKIRKEVHQFVECYNHTEIKEFDNFQTYLLATKIEIKSFLFFLRAKNLGKKEKEIKRIEERAKALKVYTKPKEALIQGKDLINLGFKPSKKFSYYLEKSYNAQIKGLFTTKEEALHWSLKNLLA